MKNLIAIVALSVCLGSMVDAAEAMPVSGQVVGGPEVQLVAQGCGPNASRGTAGRCRSNAYFARRGRCVINRAGRTVCR